MLWEKDIQKYFLLYQKTQKFELLLLTFRESLLLVENVQIASPYTIRHRRKRSTGGEGEFNKLTD